MYQLSTKHCFNTYTVVSCIYAPPPTFSAKDLAQVNHDHATKMIFVETPTLSISRPPWQCKNEASIHRTAKEFTVDRKRVCK